MDKNAKELLEQDMLKLRKEERKIVELFYALEGNKPHTLEEIGEIMHLTKEGARMRLYRSLKILQHEVRKRRPDYDEEEEKIGQRMNEMFLKKISSGAKPGSYSFKKPEPKVKTEFYKIVK